MTAAGETRVANIMLQHGFVRVAAAVPSLRVADCAFNVERMLGLLQRAENDAVAIVVFPELAITGYTCADLFQQTALQRRRHRPADLRLVRESSFSGLAVVGVPLMVNDQLYNCAAVFQAGSLLGIVPEIVHSQLQGVLRSCAGSAPANDPRDKQLIARRRDRAVRHRSALRRRRSGSRAGRRRRDLRRPVDADPAELPASPRRGDGAAQPVGQQRDYRQGRLSPATRRQPVGPLRGRVRCTLVAAFTNRRPTSSSAAIA